MAIYMGMTCELPSALTPATHVVLNLYLAMHRGAQHLARCPGRSSDYKEAGLCPLSGFVSLHHLAVGPCVWVHAQSEEQLPVGAALACMLAHQESGASGYVVCAGRSRHAGVRAAGCAAHGRLRRLLGRGARAALRRLQVRRKPLTDPGNPGAWNLEPGLKGAAP